MSPAQEQLLLSKNLELAHQLSVIGQARPFWHERQLNAEERAVRLSTTREQKSGHQK
jgi:hypothetical protein